MLWADPPTGRRGTAYDARMSDQPDSFMPRLARRDPVDRVPQAVAGEPGRFVVDATWGVIQPLRLPGGIDTVGELEVIDHLRQGGRLVDCRHQEYVSAGTIPTAIAIPHEQIVDALAEPDGPLPIVLFCNGPQCTATPQAVAALMEAGWAPDRLALLPRRHARLGHARSAGQRRGGLSGASGELPHSGWAEVHG